MKVSILIAILISWCGAAIADGVIIQKEGNVSLIDSLGNLASDRDPGCISLTEADSRLSPPDLLLGVVHCLKAGRAKIAVDLDMLLLARTAFDTKRVIDKTSHDAAQVLQIELHRKLLKEDIAAYQSAFEPLKDPETPAFAALCTGLRGSGTPDHDPGYMISHGMDAITGVKGDPLVAGFDASATWEDLLNAYMKCPKS